MKGAIRVHIMPHLGHVLADVLSRDQVRATVKRVMVRVPRAAHPGSSPRWQGGGTQCDRRASQGG